VVAEVGQAPREIGQEGIGSGFGEAPIDVDGLLARGQRLLAAAEVGEADAEVVQAHREMGQEGVGSGFGEAPIDVEGLLARGQRLLAAAEVGEADAEVAEPRGEVTQNLLLVMWRDIFRRSVSSGGQFTRQVCTAHGGAQRKLHQRQRLQRQSVVDRRQGALLQVVNLHLQSGAKVEQASWGLERDCDEIRAEYSGSRGHQPAKLCLRTARFRAVIWPCCPVEHRQNAPPPQFSPAQSRQASRSASVITFSTWCSPMRSGSSATSPSSAPGKIDDSAAHPWHVDVSGIPKQAVATNQVFRRASSLDAANQGR
jgi:hypothetical protein